MPVGYLIAVLVPALPTAAALARPPRSWTLGQLCWRLAFQVNELPVLAAVWVVVNTALAAIQGDLGTPVGIAGVSLAALTLAALVVVMKRAIQAGPAAVRALAVGLGEDVGRKDLPGESTVGTSGRRRPWLRVLFAPLAVRRHDVVRLADLAYGAAGRRNLLDVYLPRSRAAAGPCLVYFHGGGYRSGRKNREARALIYGLASQGWLCVSANYRLAGDASYPAPLIDAKRVIAWTREHAASYGADPSTIVVSGSSAGAHLAAMTALTAGDARLQPGFEAADTRVSAGICMYGFYGSPTWIETDADVPSAPMEHVREGAPPMLVVHGTNDSFVSVCVARQFVERFRTAAPASPLVYLELPGAQHTFDLYRSFRFDTVVRTAEVFTARVLSPAKPDEHVTTTTS